jgi:hypothetical protein
MELMVRSVPRALSVPSVQLAQLARPERMELMARSARRVLLVPSAQLGQLELMARSARRVQPDLSVLLVL